LGALNAKSILEFVDNGNNLMIVADGSLSKILREVATESGVQFDDDNTRAIDHFNYDTSVDDGKHTTIVLDQESEFSAKPVVISNRKQFTQRPVLFQGLAMSLKSGNPLLLPILTGSGSSYSYSSESIITKPLVRGRRTVLVGGLQSRNGARITFVGSKTLLSNSFFDASVHKSGSSSSQKSGNAEFAEEITRWAFQERGVLRHRDVFHYNTESKDEQNPSVYRVKDHAVYTVVIEEWSGSKWEPFTATDIQLDFIMLHPYVRTGLKHVGNGKYEARVHVPDVYGVYKLKVDYRRTGYTPLTFEDQVTVRPMKINEFERFIPAAFPYYASIGSSMVALLIFVVAFLFTGDKVKKE
jgi:oligosaccharyltransferase complex subunit beta